MLKFRFISIWPLIVTWAWPCQGANKPDPCPCKEIVTNGLILNMARVKLPFWKLPSHLALCILLTLKNHFTNCHTPLWHSTWFLLMSNLKICLWAPRWCLTIPGDDVHAPGAASRTAGAGRVRGAGRWGSTETGRCSGTFPMFGPRVLTRSSGPRRRLSHTTIMGADVSEAGFCFYAALIPHLGGPKRTEAPNSVHGICLSRNWWASWSVTGAQEIIPHLLSKLFCEGNKIEMFIL